MVTLPINHFSVICIHSFCVFVHAQLCPKLCDLMDCRPPGFFAIEFSRQEYWSGLPFPTPGDLPDPVIEPTCPALAGRFFTTESPGKPWCNFNKALRYSYRSSWISHLKMFPVCGMSWIVDPKGCAQVLTLMPVNVTLFSNKVFEDGIRSRWGHDGAGGTLNPIKLVSL